MTATMPADVEHLVRDYLAANLDESTCDIRIGVEDSFRPTTTASALDVGVSFAGIHEYPVLNRSRVRLVAYAVSTTEAKRLASKALGVLAAHPGDGNEGICGVLPLTGPDPAHDPATHTELAAVELQVSVRNIPVP